MLILKPKTMKKLIKNILYLLLAVPLLFTGCQKSELLENSNSSTTILGDNSSKFSIVYAPCGNQLIATLYSEGSLTSTGPFYNTSVSYGTVTVGNDLVNLYVTYQANPGDSIESTFVYAGTPEGLTSMTVPGLPNVVNSDGTGYFHPGYFPYIRYPRPRILNYTQVIPLSSLPDCFIIAAIADIKVKNVAGYIRVLAKASPELKCYGFYLDYCKQRCGNSACETAYAFGNNSANCFITIPGVTSNNWGWSNGPIGAGTYSWPIYAGAGQCDIQKGTLVGTLNVVYAPPTTTITFNMGKNVRLSTTHLYVGNDILAKKNNKWTTAPGQFPYKHEGLNGVYTDSYTISGLSGKIYISAHSDVCW
jgi:hypothetical protein